MRVLLHIGLCKTGTSFLQSEIFPRLSDENLFEKNDIIYNPSEIYNELVDVVCRNRDFAAAATLKEKIEARYQNETLLLSYEGLSVSITRQFEWARNDFRGGLDILKAVFPEAEVVVFLRYQPDLVCSEYFELNKCVVLEAPHIPTTFAGFTIEELLCYENDEFETPPGLETPRIDVRFSYSDLVEMYREAYGAENLNVFFFEDFSENGEETLRELYDFIGIKKKRNFKTKTVNSKFSDLTFSFISAIDFLHRSRINRKRLEALRTVPVLRESFQEQRQRKSFPELAFIMVLKILMLQWLTRPRIRNWLNTIDPYTHLVSSRKRSASRVAEMRERLVDQYIEDNRRLHVLFPDLPKRYCHGEYGRRSAHPGYGS